MNLEKIHLPNIRRLFIPDPGFTIADADLSGADAQVVAWEAEDEDLKAAFREGIKLHDKNARDMFPDVFDTPNKDPKDIIYPGSIGNKSYYDVNKRLVHATNYGGKPRGVAATVGVSEKDSNWFNRRWLDELHPGIRLWHARTDQGLMRDGTVRNQFGYHCIFFDRSHNLLPKALAWIPQSTVAITCFRGALRLRRMVPECQILLQVHDSLVFQYPTRMEDRLVPRIYEALHNTVPYKDPLVIPWGLKTSTKSWGHCEKYEGEWK